MSRKKYCNPKAICPYYLHEVPSMIYCDSTEEGEYIHLAFSVGAKAKDWKKRFCQSGYEDCMIYQMIERKEDAHGTT